MWRDEKTEYLRKNRDYSGILAGDDAEIQTPRSSNRGRSKERQSRGDDGDDASDPERQEYLNRRRRLKELERQKLTKGKNGVHSSGSRDEVSKASGHNKDQGRNKGGGGLAVSKERKSTPYRRFGVFFGPSEPVVAKRVIEESRAREQAEMVAARAEVLAAREARHEAEKKKSVARLPPTGKSARDSGPARLPKPVDKATEKARKLKEARDYSFLYDNSPLPGPKMAQREGPTSSNPRLAKDGTASAKANSNSSRKLPSELPKSTMRARVSDESTAHSRSFQSQSKSSQPSRSIPKQGSDDRHPSGRLTSSQLSRSIPKQGPDDRHSSGRLTSSQHLHNVDKSANFPNGKVSSAGPGRPDPRKEKDSRKAALVRKVVTGSTTSNGNKLSADRRPQPSQLLVRKSSQTVDRPPIQVKDRTANEPSNRPQYRATERQPAQTMDRRPTLVKDRELVMAKASQRVAGTAQNIRRGVPSVGVYRVEVAREEPRREASGSHNLKRKPSTKGASEPPLSNYPRKREHWRSEPRRNIAPSLSDDEEDDDSFIDDDDDPGNVSSMIHSIMGYNPNKYRGNDDFDDRTMEVGFRTIQAEERRSAREARFEDERELAMIEAEEREERLRKAKKKRKQIDR